MDLDQNLISLAVSVSYVNNERFISSALLNQDARSLQVCEFTDNEHFSTFECLILQSNPNHADAKFVVIIMMPELENEAKKLKDIFEQCDFEVIEKSKKDFLQLNDQNLDRILDKPHAQYIQESHIANGPIQCLLEHYKLYKDDSNKKTFHLSLFSFDKFMKLDLAASNALMIFPRAQTKIYDNTVSSTLVDYLDKCGTAMGKRCLRRWIKMPLQSVHEINQRLNIVQFLNENIPFRSYLQDEFLRKIPDLDKLYSKFYKVENNKRNNANLSDCLKVYQLIQKMHDLIRRINVEMAQKQHHILFDVFQDPFTNILDQFAKLEQLIDKSIDLDKAQRGDFVVNPRFSEKLQILSKQIQKIMTTIEDVRLQTEADLGIQVSLAESGNYTYIFEAKKQQADDAFRKNPKKYKTLTVKNRVLTFTLEELQQAVIEYNHLKEEYSTEQVTVVDKILKIVSSYYPAMESASRLISEIDVLTSFSFLTSSSRRELVRPVFNDRHELILKDSRHPLLEALDSNFVMNDLEMNQNDSRLHIITGPNMGGKSTYIRQVAISVLLAHIGCYVPCSYASLPIIDAIITRVGASDVQTRGISTFMSEMLETSCMLKTAKQESLIIIDELGRGTSTSEGFGIAWAIAEYIATELKSYCLFATHFHEMTLLEQELPYVKNYYVSCVTIDDKITMQYKVRAGAVDRSYGLLVAEMLKFPKEVIDDAKQKALELETFEHNLNQMEEEMPIFQSTDEKIRYNIKNCNMKVKERIIQEHNKFTNLINQENNEKNKKQLEAERKAIILKLLS